MELTRTYYSFRVAPPVKLDVTLLSGHPVEYGTTDLPFQAEGALEPGQTQTFDRSFVVNAPGRSDVEVGPFMATPEPMPEIPPLRAPPGVEQEIEQPNEAEMRAGGVTAVMDQQEPE